MIDPTAVCHECNNHGCSCCMHVRLCVHKSELKPFSGLQMANKLPPGHRIIDWDTKNELLLYSSGKDPCVFLDSQTKKCQIYTERPLICRLFPLLWKPNQKGKIQYSLDLNCALVYIIPLLDILQWVEQTNNLSELSFMKKLQFDGRKSAYLSLNILDETLKKFHTLKGNIL